MIHQLVATRRAARSVSLLMKKRLGELVFPLQAVRPPSSFTGASGKSLDAMALAGRHPKGGMTTNMARAANDN